MGADNELDGLADEFARGGVVGHQQSLAAHLGQSAADDFNTKSLGSLNGPKPGTVERALNQLAIGGFFNGVGDRLGGDGGASLAGGFDSRSDVALAGAGSGGIL